MINILKNNRWLLILVVFFIITRIFGLGQLYHQDEYRWASIANPEEFGELNSPHPPIMEALFDLAGKFLGYDNLRLVPLILSVINLILVFIISFKLTGRRSVAYLASALFILNVYSFIANLMIDIDGAGLPLFVLLTYYFYLKVFKDNDKKFIGPLIAAIIGGFLVKLSFILFIGALAVEYLWTLYDKGVLKNEIKKAALVFGFLIVAGVIVYSLYGLSHPLFIKYSSGFKYLNFSSRAYFDLFLRLFKFFIWFSPLLFFPMIHGLFKKETLIKYRPWYIYTLFNLLFYLVIFDFTRLPVERYFMFIIIPAILISADILQKFISRIDKKYLIIGATTFILILIWVLSIEQAVIPLNPKDAYLDKIKEFDLNFLIPLTGGSGPIGFYISAQFVFWTWLVCAIGLFMNKKRWAVSLFLIFGVAYNILLSHENLTGIMYGSVNNITEKSLGYVIKNPNINKVITYYDAGAYYLLLADKYEARFYTAPTRDYTARMMAYRGHYMIVDFPAIDKHGLYWELISQCKLEKTFTDKYVNSYIFNCSSLFL